jgi:hypothetical protein
MTRVIIPPSLNTIAHQTEDEKRQTYLMHSTLLTAEQCFQLAEIRPINSKEAELTLSDKNVAELVFKFVFPYLASLTISQK